MNTVTEQLATYAASSHFEQLPEHVVHHSKRVLIDWFAAIMPGSKEAPATLLIEALDDEVGNGRAVIAGTALRAPLRTAALINATAAHIVEFDDIFRDAIYHPGCPVIGSALAAAQTKHVDGRTLLNAIVVGYEVSTRIGATVQPSHYKYWHTTGTIGTFGAAAAVASVLGLDIAGHAHALANAATFAAGLQQAFRSDAMSKPLHAGHAAEAGAMAAMAAAKGVTGALDVLEGEAGFGPAMSDVKDWRRVTEGLGTQFNITQMTVKNHGCCGHIFASVDAALALRPQFSVDEIEEIRVGTCKTALDVTNRPKVITAFDGRFSTQYTVANALIYGSVRLDAFTPKRLSDPQVIRLMQKVKMHVDEKCQAIFPTQRASIVEIVTRDGKTYSYFQPTRKGDPDDPLSDAELSDKFMELVTPVLGEPDSKTLLKVILQAERLSAKDLATLGLRG